jgi:antitoxin component YwqK of YwqJK toxin-antitoxin module
MKSSQDFENNKPTGLHTFWFDNGTKRAEINYEDGRRDGEILEICERYISTHPDINFSTLVRVAVGSFLASKGCY